MKATADSVSGETYFLVRKQLSSPSNPAGKVGERAL